MSTVIDAFVVTLGLDASQFNIQQRQAYDQAKKLEEQQIQAAKNIEYGADKAAGAIGGIRTQALEMLAVLTGGAGLVSFGVNLTHANASLGRLERNIGVSASTISKWQGVARIFGGDAQTMAASFTTISDAFAGWKIGAATPLIADLRAISSAGGKIIDVNKGVEQSYLDLAENLKNIHDRGPEGAAQAGLLGRRIGLDPALFDAMISGNLQKVLDLVSKIGVATTEDTDAFGELEKRMGLMGLKSEQIGRQVLGGEGGGASIIMRLADWLNRSPGEAGSEFLTWLSNGQALAGTAQASAPTAKYGTLFGAPSDGNPAWRTAIANIESRGSGGYAAVGPQTRSGDRAYGKYQIMGNNIGEWSQAALGKRISIEEFMASPEAQDKIFDHRFGQYVRQFGNPQDAASAWLTGKPLSGGADRRDINGTSGAEYVRRFNAEGGGGGTSTSETHVENVYITAPAGSDPKQFAAAFSEALKRQGMASQANAGAQ